MGNEKNHFYWFFIKFFKKKKKKKIKKKRKKKFFKFKRRRFRFKHLRKHVKIFKFKKKRKKKDIIVDMNFVFYYNFLAKLNKIKKLKIKFKENSFFFKKNIELNTLNKFKVVKIYKNNFKIIKYNIFNFKKLFFFKKSFLNLNLKKNLIFLKPHLFKYKYKNTVKKLSKLFFKFKFLYSFFKNSFKINFFSFFYYYNVIFVFYDFFFKKTIFHDPSLKKLKSIKYKNRKINKRKKRWFSRKIKFFKLKRKYKYKSKSIFYKKLNMRRSKLNLKRGFYKILFKKLITTLRFKPNFFMFNNLNKYNFYFFLNLKKDIESIKIFFKKNFIFFDFFKKKLNNSNVIYNNHTPIYITSKNTIKKFRKIFKLYFGKKFSNHLHYYVIPFFENFLQKKIMIKSFNLNIFKKKKIVKKFLYIKLLKIFKKNKLLVLSRTVKFNLPELLQIILYSFYKKDIYLLLNWFLRNFKDVYFTGHKNFLSFFKIILTDIFESYRNVFKIKGFFFIIKGKIGVTSNAKKKTIKFIVGSINKSNKSLKIDFQQNVVKSLSGSLGVSMVLSY